MADKKLPPSQPLPSRLMQNRWRRIGDRLRNIEVLVLVLGVLAVLVHAGMIGNEAGRIPAVSAMIVCTMTWLSTSRFFRYLKAVPGSGLERLWNAGMFLPIIWVLGSILLQTGPSQQIPAAAKHVGLGSRLDRIPACADRHCRSAIGLP